MKITTLPVYSKLADPKNIPLDVLKAVPEGQRLSQHQVDTYRALTEGDYDVIFNTAMTGDGKSLAGQLPAMIRGGINWPTMVMYPTNELIADQIASLGATAQKWNTGVKFGLLNSAELDRVVADDNYARRGEALIRILRNNDLVLTNPDIFHYVMHQFYTFPKDAPEKFAAPLAQKFEQLTFDEFHIFDAPQIVSVLNALLFIHEIGGQARKNKFLFLSATPRQLLLDYLNRSRLRVCEIQGQYSSETDTQEWRKILNQTEINFVPEIHAQTWVEDHLEDILLPFFLERAPHAKGAIIVNSLASAYRLFEKIKPTFENYGLHVETNTGLASRSQRKSSYQADLLIGTSTVDVGVDFQINFLIFESRDAGSFLQRLGRLGRHDRYLCDGNQIAFQDYCAYALIPKWIDETLFKGKDSSPALLQNDDVIERQALSDAMEAAFPPATEFDQYARRWGKFQSIKILWGLGRTPIKEQYRETRPKLQERYDAAFGFHVSGGFRDYKVLVEDKSPLLQNALSFRGSSEFPCCVIDMNEISEKERFKNTDLLQMVSNHKLDYSSEKDFYTAAQQAGLRKNIFEGQNPLGFFRRYGISEERQDFHFFLDVDLQYWSAAQFGKACRLRRFRLDAAFPGSNEINQRLERRELPALLCSGLKPLDIKRRLNLPLLFPLFEFTSRDNVSGTVAFGRTALMLDSRLFYHPMPCGGEAIIA
jgi:CRISPR-associated endonuclease/helicase Cas3